jgi:hypothetical protein
MFLISEFEGMLIPFVKKIQYNLIIREYKKTSVPPTIEVIVELWFFFCCKSMWG